MKLDVEASALDVSIMYHVPRLSSQFVKGGSLVYMCSVTPTRWRQQQCLWGAKPSDSNSPCHSLPHHQKRKQGEISESQAWNRIRHRLFISEMAKRSSALLGIPFASRVHTSGPCCAIKNSSSAVGPTLSTRTPSSSHTYSDTSDMVSTPFPSAGAVVTIMRHVLALSGLRPNSASRS